MSLSNSSGVTGMSVPMVYTASTIAGDKSDPKSEVLSSEVSLLAMPPAYNSASIEDNLSEYNPYLADEPRPHSSSKGDKVCSHAFEQYKKHMDAMRKTSRDNFEIAVANAQDPKYKKIPEPFIQNLIAQCDESIIDMRVGLKRQIESLRQLNHPKAAFQENKEKDKLGLNENEKLKKEREAVRSVSSKELRINLERELSLAEHRRNRPFEDFFQSMSQIKFD